jgi:acetyl esterase/lipase
LLEANPLPSSSSWTISDLKTSSAAALPNIQESLASNRPENVTEKAHHIPMRDGYMSRVLILEPCTPNLAGKPGGGLPVLLMFHGGGHCVGYPEWEVPLLRLLVVRYNMICIAPSYRFAPENPFPASINDAWDTLQWVASEGGSNNSLSSPLHHADPNLGFIVGGSSAGANLAASLAHLARDNMLKPPLSGQFLSVVTVMDHEHVPAKYQNAYLSWEQNKSAPILDQHLYSIFNNASKRDPTSELWASFNHPNGHEGLPKAYFQVCGLDIFRDDGLIYERVLREEAGVETKMDLYKGLPHSWWSRFPGIEASKRRMEDSVSAVGWLLGSEEGGDAKTESQG